MTELTRAQLIALINTVIVANNVGEITGPVLNSVLVDIADSVGTLLDPNTTWSAEEMTIDGLLQFGSTTGISGTATLGTLPVTNTLLLTESNMVPFNVALSFTTSAAVLAYFGAGNEATLAAQYFADGSPSTLIIIRYPTVGGNARVYGAPLSLTLTQLQAINGTLSVTADGQVFSASINLSGATSFPNAASLITTALNTTLPTVAVCPASSIAPISFSVVGYVSGGTLYVTSAPSQYLYPGTAISGNGLGSDQICTQLSGTPGGIGQYSLIFGFSAGIASATFTATYGILTLGSFSSGSAGIGVTVAGTTPFHSAVSQGGAIIYANLDPGAGSASLSWMVDQTQTVASTTLTLVTTPLSVNWNAQVLDGFAVTGSNIGASYGATHTIGFVSGTAAAALGLTQAAGAVLSNPGQVTPVPATFMAYCLALNPDWVGFQIIPLIDSAGFPQTQNEAFSAWAATQSTNVYLGQSSTTMLPGPKNASGIALGHLLLGTGNQAQTSVYKGSAGEVLFDTDNDHLVAYDGETPGGWPAAKLAEVVTNTYLAVADASYSALATDRSINYTSLTASRTVTLPAAASFPTGTPFRVRDDSGNCTPTKSIALATAGSDVFVGEGNLGSTSSIALEWPYGLIELESDGVGTWAVTSVRLPTSWRTAVSDAAYTTVANDRMIAYTALTASRVVSLISAANFLPGTLLIIVDETGSCSPTKTITVNPNGSDAIHGQVAPVIQAANGFLILESNGSNAWTIVGQSISGISISFAAVYVTPPAANAMLTLDATSSSYQAVVNFQVAGVAKWQFGQQGGADDYFFLYNAATATNVIQVDAVTNNVTFDGNVFTPNVSYILGQSRIPFILPGAGTMGNNGAITGLTSLPRTYNAPGAYIYLPAGAIASGSAAGWYWFVASSATAGTVYNNTYSSGTPAAPGSPTAFSTTGPGAWTLATATYFNAYTLAIAGNVVGVNGSVRLTGDVSFSSSTNAKTFAGAYGSYVFGSSSPSASGNVSSGIYSGFGNCGVTNSQSALTSSALGTAASSVAPAYGAIDSTTSQNLTVQLKLAATTDFIVLEGAFVEILPGVP